MKMAAAQKRTEATAINLRNMVSYLDTQDGAFKVADKVLSRMSELAALSRDVSKNAGDVENYNKEFANLKLQMASLATEKFNGVQLFDTNSTGDVFTVPTSEDGSQNTTVTQAGLASDPMTYMMINGFDTFQVTDAGGNTRTFIAPLTPGVDWGENGGVAVTFGPATAGGSVNAFEIPGGVGSAVQVNLATGAVTPWNSAGVGSITVNGKTVDSAASAMAAGSTVVRNPDNDGVDTGLIGTNTQLTDLKYDNSAAYAYLSQEALQQVADMRAQNVNAVNLEAANSRIMDVDVAAESSQLARFQILQQAGTAMLAQANTSQQSLVRLLQG
jgi:flagellin-like hook-associated protein FlgL